MANDALTGSVPDNWEVSTLGEIVQRAGGHIQTGPFGSQLHASDYVEVGIPSIMPVNIGEGRVIPDGIARITEDDARRLSRHRVSVGDIVYSRRGDVERHALIQNGQAGWLCGTGCIKVTLGQGVVIPRYASYYLRHPATRAWISRHAVGATMPNLNMSIMSEVPFVLPPPKTQYQIADVLGKLDDKIELNRRMNRTLEKMAAAIFKSWFIDFDPVHAKAEGRDPTSGGLPADIADLFPDAFEDSDLGPIPKGWDVKPLDKVADYLNGLACQKHPAVEGQKSLPVIKIRELRQGITGNTDRASVDVPPKYIVEDGDILFSWSGSLLVTIWCGGRGVLNQHVFKVTSASYPKWFFYQATKHHLDEFQRIASDKATTMGHIKRHHLTDAKMAIPGEELMAKATEVLGTMLDRRITVLKQARILALTRDTLLPKLLSGEIDPGTLPAAEAVVEGVK